MDGNQSSQSSSDDSSKSSIFIRLDMNLPEIKKHIRVGSDSSNNSSNMDVSETSIDIPEIDIPELNLREEVYHFVKGLEIKDLVIFNKLSEPLPYPRDSGTRNNEVPQTLLNNCLLVFVNAAPNHINPQFCRQYFPDSLNEEDPIIDIFGRWIQNLKRLWIRREESWKPQILAMQAMNLHTILTYVCKTCQIDFINNIDDGPHKDIRKFVGTYARYEVVAEKHVNNMNRHGEGTMVNSNHIENLPPPPQGPPISGDLQPVKRRVSFSNNISPLKIGGVSPSDQSPQPCKTANHSPAVTTVAKELNTPVSSPSDGSSCIQNEVELVGVYTPATNKKSKGNNVHSRKQDINADIHVSSTSAVKDVVVITPNNSGSKHRSTNTDEGDLSTLTKGEMIEKLTAKQRELESMQTYMDATLEGIISADDQSDLDQLKRRAQKGKKIFKNKM